MSHECGFVAMILAMVRVTVIGGGDFKNFLQVHKGAFAILVHVRDCLLVGRNKLILGNARYYMFVSSEYSIQISISSPVRFGKLRFLR